MFRLGPILVLLGALQWSCAAGPGERSPNVVVVLVDTLRADHLGAYGYGAPTSPELDALAGDGVLFTQAMSPASWTKPSIPSIFTGLYPIGHGVHTGNRAEGGRITSNVLGHDHLTLAEAFQDAGYRTGAFIHNTQIAGFLGFDQGFDTYEEEVGDANRITDACLGWLDASGDGPFLAYVHYLDPHWPYTPPPEFAAYFPAPENGIDFNNVNWKAFERMVDAGEIELSDADLEAMQACYDGEIRYADAAIGRLLEGLASRGLEGNTVVVVTADHGEEFREHGRLGHGESLYDEVLHVPLIFRVPGRKPGRVETPVELIDILPTLLDIAGLPSPGDLSGESLVPLIRGESVPPSPTFAHHRPEGDAGLTLESVRTDRHKLIRTFAPSEAAKERGRSRWQPPEFEAGQWLEIEGPVGASGAILALEVEAIDPEDFMKMSGPIESLGPGEGAFVVLGRRCRMEEGAKIKNEDGERLRDFVLEAGMWVEARGVPDGSGGLTVNRVKLLERKKEEEIVGPLTAVRGSGDELELEVLGFAVTLDEDTDFENLEMPPPDRTEEGSGESPEDAPAGGIPTADGSAALGGNDGPREPEVEAPPAEPRLLRVELYDLAEDPGERNDIAEQHPRLVADLTAILDEWKRVHGEKGEREEVALSKETIEKLRSLGYLN